MNKLLLLLGMILLTVSSVHAQKTISGTVKDDKGEPMVGASVVVKGTTSGTITDVDGSYLLKLPANATTVVFSFIGTTSIEKSIGDQNTIDAILTATKALDEVVIVGYGTQTKRSTTGSVAQVNSDKLEKLSVTSLDQALQGQAAGVMVFANSGTPGGGISVRINGPSSITASNQPLYIVDGVPISNNNFAQLGAGNQQPNAISDLNPADIASIEILKDAASAAIYGSRASNGVVLITTKRGKAGKSKITLNTYYGKQEAWKTLNLVNGPQFTRLNNEMRRAAGLATRYTDTVTTPTTDWMSEIFRSAPMSQTDLAFEGGTEKLTYRIGGSYFLQDGIILGSSFKRFSLRANVDNQINSKLKLSFGSAVSRSMSNRINNDNNINGVLSTAILHGTHLPVKDELGNYIRDPFNSVENPVAAALEPTFESPTSRLFSNVALEWAPIEGLRFRSNVGVDAVFFREFRFSPTTTNTGAGVRGQGFETYFGLTDLINENIANYNKEFGDFSVDALGGLSFQKTRFETLFAQGENFPGNTIKALQAAAVKKDAQSDRSGSGLNSQFGRLKFGFKKKLYVEGVVRRDGSSRFGTAKKYGIFPGASVTYILSDEKFLANSKIISNLKLRAGWGQRGNSNILDFASRGLIRGGAAYNQIAGLAQTQLGDENLGWETRTDLNVGANIGFLKDRIQLELEYYQAQTTDLLLNRQLMLTSGFLSITQNVGAMENNGFNLGFTSVNINNKNFSWKTNLNISTNKNKVTNILQEQLPGFASSIDTGFALGSFKGYRTVKIFQNQAEIDALNKTAQEKSGRSTATYQTTSTRPGDLMFKDLDGDGLITGNDQEILGDANPAIMGGINNEFKIYDFDISVFLQYSFGNKVWNHTRVFAEGMNGQFGQLATVENRWTPTNGQTDIRYPRAIWGDPNNNRRNSDRFLEDGSYMRIKNLNIGYRLPQQLLKRIGLSNLRVYYSGQNLWTATKYEGSDPEVSTFSEGNASTTVNGAPGTDFLTFPIARAHNFGLQVSF
jgi:TonB-dependent starch-binding outer membrane protein SusC